MAHKCKEFALFSSTTKKKNRIILVMVPIFFVLLLFLVGCEKDPYQRFREEGRESTQRVIEELKAIKNRDQLVAREKKLGEAFAGLRQVFTKADAYHKEHPEEVPPPLLELDQELSHAFKLELLRVKRIEGAEELLYGMCAEL